VLAADTVVALGRRILPKPDDAAGSRACLAMLSGRRHLVLTAVVLIAPGGARSQRLSTTAVAFARLTEAQLDAYATSGEGVGKAGGYAIQGRAAAFVRLLSGSYSGVVGLPLFETAQLLRGRGYPVP
jgi:septum formation protein